MEKEESQTPGAAKLFRKAVNSLRKKGQYSSPDQDKPSAKMVRASKE